MLERVVGLPYLIHEDTQVLDAQGVAPAGAKLAHHQRSPVAAEEWCHHSPQQQQKQKQHN